MRQAGAALVGGETAEMPDMYSQDEYDLAGYATGVVDQDKMLTTALPKAGDVLIGLASSGIHSNGYSLVRQVLFKDNDVKLSDQPAELNGQTVGEALLTPTRIYVKPVLPLIKKGLIHGVSHITGGGLPENLPRMFADSLQAVVDASTWPKLPIFSYLQKMGDLDADDLYGTFNMGLGMILAVAPENVAAVQDALKQAGEDSWQIGRLQDRPADEEKLIIE